MLWNEDQLPRVKKERKPTLRGVFSGRHIDNVPKETMAPGNSGEGQRRKGSGNKEESSLGKSEIPCRLKFGKTRHVSSGILLIITSQKRMCKLQPMSFPTCWGRRKAQRKVKEKLWKRISCDIEGDDTIGMCVSRFLSEKVYSTWRRKIGIETRRQILQRHLAQN